MPISKEAWITLAAGYYRSELALGRKSSRIVATALSDHYTDAERPYPLAAVSWDIHENDTPLVDPDTLPD